MKKSILAVSAFLGLLVSCTVEISPGSNSTSKEPTTANATSSTLLSTSQTPSSSTVIPSTSNTSSSSSSIEERDYLTIEEALVAANDEEKLNFADYSSIVDGTKQYKVRGIVNRIDRGADGKNNLYIESLSSANQPVGLYVYGASNIDNASLGATIEVTGVFKNFRGCVEIIPTSIETIGEEGINLVTPSSRTVNELLSSNYLDQGRRIIIKKC